MDSQKTSLQIPFDHRATFGEDFELKPLGRVDSDLPEEAGEVRRAVHVAGLTRESREHKSPALPAGWARGTLIDRTLYSDINKNF